MENRFKFMALVRRFLADSKGNFGVMFAICCAVLILGVSAVLDISFLHKDTQKLQTNLDGAVLAAAISKSSGQSDEQLEQLILEEMMILNADSNGSIIYSNPVLSRQGDTLIVNTDVTFAPKIKFYNKENKTFNMRSEATIVASPAEMVLVLDNSYSMQGSRISTLQTAAKDLVETLVIPGDNNFKLGIVPFNTHVNVGIAKRNEAWLDVGSDYSEFQQVCSITTQSYKNAGCWKKNATCTTDGVSRPCKKWVCPNGANPKKTCQNKEKFYKFYGCVASRKHPKNITDAPFLADRSNGIIMTGSWHCPTELTDLSSDKTELITKLEAMAVRGDTYIPAGLTWAYRLMTPQTPFTQAGPFPDAQNRGTAKTIVLMSDGANSRSPRYRNNKSIGKDHFGGNTNQANQYTAEACTEIKSKGIEIYTIAFEVTDTDTIDMLRLCATSNDHAYVATDAALLKESFKVIASEFKTVRLKR